MKNKFSIFYTGSLLTLVYLFLFLFYHWQPPFLPLIIAVPFFIIAYFLVFNLGKPEAIQWFEENNGLEKHNKLIIPILLLGLLYGFLWLNSKNPFEGSAGLLFFLFLFPTLYYNAFPREQIGRIDYFVLLIFAIPLTLIEPNGDTSLPIGGNGFGSLYKISWVLLLTYSFGYIRKLKDIGFYPIFKLPFLGIAILSWLSFVGFVFIIAFSLGFVNPDPFKEIIKDGFSKSLLEMMRIWIGTALFEELFFRGLLQNMLSQQINRAKKWKTYWNYGFIIVLVLSILAGYALAIEYIWFPVMVTLALFFMAYYLEKKSFQAVGTYTALAIISMVFGLAHFHKDSIIFVGLAAVAGWAYGYTYIKTKNVFYAALVHTLVNFSQFFFLLKQIK
jgi:membrane protease YdiL (CAAX protease family)